MVGKPTLLSVNSFSILTMFCVYKKTIFFQLFILLFVSEIFSQKQLRVGYINMDYILTNLDDYNIANEKRTHLRWAWHEFFKEYDAVIAPIMATDAIEHDHGAFGNRTVMVDNDERPYFEQIFWAGLAIASYLPSTIIPTGLSDKGLPIGIQIIGPQYGDLKTIGLAKLLEQEGYKFQAPNTYPD